MNTHLKNCFLLSLVLLFSFCLKATTANEIEEGRNQIISDARRAYNIENFDQAINCYKKASQINALEYKDFIILADIYYRKGDLLRSAQMDEIAFFMGGKYEDIERIAIKYRDAGDPFSALSFLYKAEEWSGDASSFHYEKGKYYNLIGYQVISGFYFDLAEEEDLESENVIIAHSLWEMNHFIKNAKAVENLEYLIKNKNYTQYEFYCIALVNLGQYDEAWKAIDRVEEIRGKVSRAWACSLKSTIKLSQFDYERALFYIREALEYGNNDIDYFFILADIYYRKGDLNAAIAACNEGLEKNKKEKRMINLFFTKARYEYINNKKQAAKDIQEFLKKDPESWLGFDELAISNIIINKPTTAKSIVSRYETMPLKTAEIYYRLASYYAYINNEGKSIHYLGRALGAGFDNYTLLVNNMNFFSLTENSGFKELLGELKKKNDQLILEKNLY